jgi:hypothetical protein
VELDSLLVADGPELDLELGSLFGTRILSVSGISVDAASDEFSQWRYQVLIASLEQWR